MLSNMAASLILHKRINTTLAKAKALRIYIEPLITKSKDDTTHSRRIVFSYLQSKEAVTELFREISVKVADRPGGYTRIIKTGARLGDNAEMCMMELVDYNENLLGDKGTAKAKASRRGRKKKKDDAPVVAAAVAATPAEKVADVVEEVTTEEKVETEVKAEEPVVEEKIEEPIAEVKAEEPVVDKKVEEPVAEVKAEDADVDKKEVANSDEVVEEDTKADDEAKK
jgi:large subunit ribosomal protein L17